MPALASTIPPRDTRVPLLSEGGTFQDFSVDELPQLYAEWEGLALTNPSLHLFDLPQWPLAAFRAHKPKERFTAIMCRHANQLIGILPVISRWRFLRAIPAFVRCGFTSPFSPRCELIHDPLHSILAGRLAWEALREDRRWRVLELPDVPEGGVADSIPNHAREEGFQVITLPGFSTPIIDLQQEPTTSLPAESRVYRSRLEMKLRKLGQFGDIHLRSYATVQEALRLLRNLEPQIRRPLLRTSRREQSGAVTFLTEIGEWAARRDALRIYSLEINGEPIAMLYGVTTGDTLYALKITHARRLGMYSPGQLLVMLTRQDLTRIGMKRCELVGPALPWKMVWTSSTRKHHSHYIFRPDSHGRTPLASLLNLTVRSQRMWRHLQGRATS